MKKHILSFALIWGTALPALANVLLVSDIDDTLKVSHVQALTAAAENTMHPGNHFMGMSELYNALKFPGGIQFAYVSNAPASVMSSLHSLFLRFNDFPTGGMYLRDSILGSGNHKLKIIPELIRNSHADQVILIGDNGELDPIVYSQVQNTFPNLPIHIFIHQVYSVKSKDEPATGLRVGETGFATSVDLAGELKKLGFLSEDDYQQFLQTVVPRLVKEKAGQYFGDLAFPAWMNCQDYRPTHISVTDVLMLKYEKKLFSRCLIK